MKPYYRIKFKSEFEILKSLIVISKLKMITTLFGLIPSTLSQNGYTVATNEIRI